MDGDEGGYYNKEIANYTRKKPFKCEVGEIKLLLNGDTIEIFEFSFIPSKNMGKPPKLRLELKLNLSQHLIIFEMVNLPKEGFSLIRAMSVKGNILYESSKWSIKDLCKWTGEHVKYNEEEIKELTQVVTRINTFLKNNIKERKMIDNKTNTSIKSCKLINEKDKKLVSEKIRFSSKEVSMIKELSLRFCKEVEPLHPFNKKKWFQGAYQTMQRTKKGGVAAEIRENIMNYIFLNIANLRVIEPSQANFDEWFYECIYYISNIGNLTFGQGQKIVNILLKYHYCYYNAELNQKWNIEYDYLKSFFRYFHAPVDGIILKNLKRRFNDNRINFIKISQTPKFVIGSEEFPWSKLDNIDYYRKIQDYIGELTRFHSLVDNKLAFEMVELWL
ncbi:MAG: hypothetical protein ABFC84_04000 [Veillonellales bacterium]